MTQRKNLAAYTPADPTPAYLSINLEEDGMVSITVRSKGDGDNTGPVGCIYLSAALAAAIFAETSRTLTAGDTHAGK